MNYKSRNISFRGLMKPPIHPRFLDYSIKHLVVSDDKEWRREELWSYDCVEKITINGDWKYNDDDCSNFCSYLWNLREFEVINSKGIFFTEDGALYANIKRGEFSTFGTRFGYLPDRIEGKVLVAVPTKYSKKTFTVAEGTVAICPGVFAGMNNLESIVFPDSIEYLDICCFSEMENLKTLYIPNKKVCVMDQHDLSPQMPKLCCTDASQSLSEETKEAWLRAWNFSHVFLDVTDIVCYDIERHAVFPSLEVKEKIEKAISNKDRLITFLQSCAEESRDALELPLLLMLVEPRVLRPDTSEEANLIIDLLWDSKQRATAELRYFPDNYVNIVKEDEHEVLRKIREYRKKFLRSESDEDNDILMYIHEVKDNMVLLNMAYSDPVAFLNTQDYPTILSLLRCKASRLFKKLANKNVYAAMNWLCMYDQYAKTYNPILFRYQDCSDGRNVILRKAAEMGDMVSMWTLTIEGQDGIPHMPVTEGSDIYYWLKILASKGIGLSKKEVSDLKKWAKRNLESTTYSRAMKVYESVKDEVLNRAECMARKELGIGSDVQMLGLCHLIWSKAKRIFKDEYDIDWRSPAELNPDVIFD